MTIYLSKRLLLLAQALAGTVVAGQATKWLAVSLRASLSHFTSISSYCCTRFQAMVNTDLDNDLSYMRKCLEHS